MTDSFIGGLLQGFGRSVRDEIESGGSVRAGRTVDRDGMVSLSSHSVIVIIMLWTAWIVVLHRAARSGGSSGPGGGRSACRRRHPSEAMLTGGDPTFDAGAPSLATGAVIHHAVALSTVSRALSTGLQGARNIGRGSRKQ
jgi:hypothetical protein